VTGTHDRTADAPDRTADATDRTVPALDRTARVARRERDGRWSRPPLRIDPTLCVACDRCIQACPPALAAVVRTGSLGVAVRVIPELCNGCGRCLPTCPVNCLVPDPTWTPAPDAWWKALDRAPISGGSPAGARRPHS